METLQALDEQRLGQALTELQHQFAEFQTEILQLRRCSQQVRDTTAQLIASLADEEGRVPPPYHSIVAELTELVGVIDIPR